MYGILPGIKKVHGISASMASIGGNSAPETLKPASKLSSVYSLAYVALSFLPVRVCLSDTRSKHWETTPISRATCIFKEGPTTYTSILYL